jgi:hydrogenase expression/formation protein HypE
LGNRARTGPNLGHGGVMSGRQILAGKLPIVLLERLLAEFGSLPPDVRVGPAVGEDACVLDVSEGVLVAASDPITLTRADIGRYAVIVNANDVAVMGVRPRWFLATCLLPLGTTDEKVQALFAGMRRALVDLGATLVGGHTEVTGVVSQPVVIGQMLGVAPPGRFVTTGGARAGDVVVQVGEVPIEGAAVLAVEAAAHLGDLDPQVVAAAADGLDEPGISVVDAAVSAAELGATALHDPTEGGLASGLHELAAAARVGLQIDRSQVRWFEPGLAVCGALGVEPWATLASGSVLATFSRADADRAVEVLTARGHVAAVLGEVETGSGVRDATGQRIAWPERDEVARLLGH